MQQSKLCLLLRLIDLLFIIVHAKQKWVMTNCKIANFIGSLTKHVSQLISPHLEQIMTAWLQKVAMATWNTKKVKRKQMDLSDQIYWNILKPKWHELLFLSTLRLKQNGMNLLFFFEALSFAAAENAQINFCQLILAEHKSQVSA
jgi:hypothetical protein